MDYKPQFPLWFLVGLLVSAASVAFLTFLKSLFEGALTDVSNNDWRIRLIENAPAGVLGLAALAVIAGVWMWQRSR